MPAFLKSPILLTTLLVGLVLLAGYLHLELGQRSQELDTTRTNLAASESTNTALQAEKTDLEATLSNTNRNLADANRQNIELVQLNEGLVQEKAVIQSALSASESQNARLNVDKTNLEETLGNTTKKLTNTNEWNIELTQLNEDLVQEKADVQSALATSESLNEGLRLDKSNLEESLDTVSNQLSNTSQELADANDQNVALTRTNEALTQDKADLENDLAASRYAYDELEDAKAELEEQAGTVEQLMAHAASLQEEIEELIADRRPLILSVHRQGFLCTGSMEPKLTCLDEATWLDNFYPEDITVGTIISFNPNCWDIRENRFNLRSTAHRVMKIKVEDGVHYYWPKGDASEDPDGCWVPESHVNAYIIEVHKNVQPQFAELRNSVNHASSLENKAWLELDAAEAEYDAIIERYCGPGVKPGDCTLPTSQYNIANRAYRAYDSAYKNWERYYDYHQCWIHIALAQGGRSVPLYAPCILRPP